MAKRNMLLPAAAIYRDVERPLSAQDQAIASQRKQDAAHQVAFLVAHRDVSGSTGVLPVRGSAFTYAWLQSGHDASRVFDDDCACMHVSSVHYAVMCVCQSCTIMRLKEEQHATYG